MKIAVKKLAMAEGWICIYSVSALGVLANYLGDSPIMASKATLCKIATTDTGDRSISVPNGKGGHIVVPYEKIKAAPWAMHSIKESGNIGNMRAGRLRNIRNKAHSIIRECGYPENRLRNPYDLERPWRGK